MQVKLTGANIERLGLGAREWKRQEKEKRFLKSTQFFGRQFDFVADARAHILYFRLRDCLFWIALIHRQWQCCQEVAGICENFSRHEEYKLWFSYSISLLDRSFLRISMCTVRTVSWERFRRELSPNPNPYGHCYLRRLTEDLQISRVVMNLSWSFEHGKGKMEREVWHYLTKLHYMQTFRKKLAGKGDKLSP